MCVLENGKIPNRFYIRPPLRNVGNKNKIFHYFVVFNPPHFEYVRRKLNATQSEYGSKMKKKKKSIEIARAVRFSHKKKVLQ